METTTEAMCAQCEDVYDVDHMTSYDGELYCESCAEELFTICACCHELELTEDGSTTADGDWICEHCFDRHYFCCGSCGEIYHDSRSESTPYGVYCSECFDEYYFRCNRCGDVCPNDEGGFTDDGDGPYCNYCLDDIERENEDEDNYIHSYSYRPTPSFRYTQKEKIQKTTLFFGFELEIESPECLNNIADEVTDISDLFYCKEDGSLRDGFEIVSHPMTWNYIKSKRFERILKKLNGVLRDNECTSHDNNRCGFHVHASKKHFSTLHIYKMLKFMTANQRLILTVSQRQAHRLEQWASVTDSQPTIQKARDKRSDNRYSALNLTRDTIECRIFRGNIRIDRIMKNLEFYHALISFTKNASLKDTTNKHLFLEFIENNKKEYPNLYVFLKEKNIIKQ